MKKLHIAAAAALAAFSMFGSAALADTSPSNVVSATAASAVKTSADFNDLGSIGADLKAKIDVLLAKGIMEGVSADTFGIQANMTRAQFAKVLDLSSGLKVDMKVEASSFIDVKSDDAANGWSIPYVEAAKKAGLIDGMTDTTFAPGEKVTIGQLATALLKAAGKKVDVSGSPWYAKAVQDAKQLKLIAGDADGAAAATRADLAVGGYAVYQLTNNTDVASPVVQVSIVSAKATDAQTIQVVFDQPVDTAKAVVTLSQGSTAVAAKTTWSADSKTATLTLSIGALATGDYTVALSGLDAALIKTGSASLRYESPTPPPAVTAAYVLPNVIDSGTTGLATGVSGYVYKATAEDPTVSKFAKEIVITAKNAAGEPVALPGVIQTMASSNPSVVKAGVDPATHKGYVLGVKAGTATVNLTFQILNGDMKQMNVPVEVRTDPISVVKLEAGNTGVTVTAGTFNAFKKMKLTITDNYGATYKNDDATYNEGQQYNFALGVLFTVSNIRGNSSSSVGSVTVDTAGNVTISGNVNSFDLKATSFGGKEAWTAVTVN